MARMIPVRDPATIENEGEREIYILLKEQLPASWVVRHNFIYCWEDGNRLRDGEIDFIVIAPGLGVMVIEAKGSKGYECADGHWYRLNGDDSLERTKNPFEQANTNKHRLIKRLSEEVLGCTKKDFPGIYGHVVAYPFAKVAAPISAAHEPRVMLTYQDMAHWTARLEGAFRQWGDPKTGALFGATNMGKVADFLSERARLVPVLAASASQDERHFKNLTLMQYSAFRGLLCNKRVHVRGPAGSGKTVLAMWVAEAMAAEGMDVLLVCYNRVLAKWIDRTHAGPGRLDIRTFFSICEEATDRAGVPFNRPPADADASDFWHREAPSAFCDALEKLPPNAFQRYDAVVVDEGQDFHQDWWLPLQFLLRDVDGGRLLIFSDPEQTGVYGLGQAFPEPLVPYQLRENCRNTRRIAAYCGKVLDLEVDHFPTCPIGAVPVILDAAPDPRARAELVRREVTRFIEEKFEPSEIAVLSPWKRGSGDSCLGLVAVVNNKPLEGGDRRVADWRLNRVIWTSTIKAFKGLEAGCIILADAPEPGLPGFRLADLYVAASRAKHHLVIAPTSEKAVSIGTGSGRVLLFFRELRSRGERIAGDGAPCGGCWLRVGG